MVNVDTVYQRVLALANKEQRGYITPQEFNIYANQAQLDIFEQYFYDINQFGRLPGNNTEYSDMLNILEEKMSIFERIRPSINRNNSTGVYHIGTSITDLYRIGTVSYNGKICEQITNKELTLINSSPLLKPSAIRPVYVIYGHNEQLRADVYPQSLLDSISVNYIKKPEKVNWTYVVIGDKALYNATTDSMHFELHSSEETDLVIKILQLAGITMKDEILYQVTNAEDNKNIQQEKQ